MTNANTVSFSVTIGAAPETTIFFGALTKSGAGGTALPAGETTISDAGGTNLTVVDSLIVPASDGVTAGTVTFGNGATRTITTEANAYSCSGLQEVQDVTLVDSDGSTLGKTLYLRDGTYNIAESFFDFRRNNDLSAFWTGSNWTVIKAENDYGAIIRFFSAKNSNPLYMSMEKIQFDCKNYGIRSQAISFGSGANYFRVNECRFWGEVDASRTNTDDIKDAINATSAGSHNNNTILNSDFRDVNNGIKMKGANSTIRGNFMRRFWGDGIQIIPPINDTVIEGNDMRDKKSKYIPFTITDVTRGDPTLVTVSEDVSGLSAGDDGAIVGATGLDGLGLRTYDISAINTSTRVLTIQADTTGATDWVSGGEVWVTDSHGDHLQGVFGSATADSELANISILANRMGFGDGVEVMTDAQGVFLSDNTNHSITNAVIRGNIIELKQSKAGINILNGKDVTVEFNTLIQRIMTNGEAQTLTPEIEISGSLSGTNLVRYNVATAYHPQLSTDPSVTLTGNYTITALDSAEYAADFVAPPEQLESPDLDVAYAPKTGGGIETLSPTPGAVPHQSYTAPYTFTDPTV